MKTQKLKTEFDIEVIPDPPRQQNGTKRLIMRMHVKGMMAYIKRSMPDKNKQDLLDEYAKLWLLDQLGIVEYPPKKLPDSE